jgi:hypothetical protein
MSELISRIGACRRGLSAYETRSGTSAISVTYTFLQSLSTTLKLTLHRPEATGVLEKRIAGALPSPGAMRAALRWPRLPPDASALTSLNTTRCRASKHRVPCG